MGGNFNFTGTAPTGTISIEDATEGDAIVASGPVSKSAVQKDVAAGPVYGPIFPYAAAGGDINNHGIPDALFSLNPGGDTIEGLVSVLGNADGTLANNPIPFTPPIGQGSRIIPGPATADFNSDGKADLAATDNAGNIYVLLGNGNGAFRTKLEIHLPQAFFTVLATADFDRDGIPDLAVNRYDSSAEINYIQILKGKGDGTFTAEIPRESGSGRLNGLDGSLTAADLDADGFPDLVTGRFVLLGNGDGTFGRPIALQGATPGTIGDFKGDGIPDLLVTGYGEVIPYKGNGDGTFTRMVNTNIPQVRVAAVAAGDFNGDGKLDLAVLGDLNNYGAVVLLYGTGLEEQPFEVQEVRTLGYREQFHTATAGDFDGDGITDLVVSETKYSTSDGFVDGVKILRIGTSATRTFSGLSLAGVGPHQIFARYSGDGTYAGISSAPVTLENRAADPVFTPAPGVYSWTQRVKLSDPTPDASIYYTLDGSTPTTASTLYTAPIVVGWEATIKAIAQAPLVGASDVATGSYDIERPFPPPVFSLPSGTYTGPVTITLSPNDAYCEQAVCKIYYTLHGGTPSGDSALYTAPIVLTAPGRLVIRAVTIAHHFQRSPVALETYTVP